MRRHWIILALVLVSCSTPTEPPPTPTNTPTATLPPTNTSTPEPTDTPSRLGGLSDLLLSVREVERESLPLSTETTDMRPDMMESGVCTIDCAGTIFISDAGALEFKIYMIAFESEADVIDLFNFMVESSQANGAYEVTLPEDTGELETLTSNSVVFQRGRAWSLFAGYGNIFVGVDILVRVDTGEPVPPQDIILLGILASRLAELQLENLIEAGY